MNCLPNIDVSIELVDDLDETFIQELNAIANFRILPPKKERLLRARFLLHQEIMGMLDEVTCEKLLHGYSDNCNEKFWSSVDSKLFSIT